MPAGTVYLPPGEIRTIMLHMVFLQYMVCNLLRGIPALDKPVHFQDDISRSRTAAAGNQLTYKPHVPGPEPSGRASD